MWAGPDLAQKGWADLSPIVLSVFWSGPDPSQTSGLGQHQPDLKRNKTGGGDYFPPPILMHAELYSFCMQEEMKQKTKEKKWRGKKSYLARRRRCLAGLTASLAVLRWRLVAVSWLTNGSSK